MEIKLIYPRLSDPLRGTNVKYSLVPPQSLSMLAAVTPPEHEVVIHDENHVSIPFATGHRLLRQRSGGLARLSASLHVLLHFNPFRNRA